MEIGSRQSSGDVPDLILVAASGVPGYEVVASDGTFAKRAYIQHWSGGGLQLAAANGGGDKTEIAKMGKLIKDAGIKTD